jgi:glycosyltransferase involved in cell wall biosynthesis
MQEQHIYIQAVNVHTGGGGVLLQGLLQALPKDSRVSLFADTRLQLPANLSTNITVYRFKPKILHRFRAEWLLFRRARARDTVFCFGNLPPLLPSRAHVILYLHNRYLIENRSLRGFSLKARLRIWMERLWFHGFCKNVDELYVQTASMRQLLLSQRIGQRLKHHVVPFMNFLPEKSVNTSEKKFDFIYIASADPHKNHQQLIDAWCWLAAQDLYPHLCLVLSEPESKAVKNLIQSIKQQQALTQLNISFFNDIDFGYDLTALYQASRALIYPSLVESLGLPLLEAKHQGVAIVASELDYVRDIVQPDQTFDPTSFISIGRAVMRFLEIPELTPALLTPEQFLAHLIGNHGIKSGSDELAV